MLIATSRGILSTLYPALILTITNVSPYLKSLSVTSSSKLVGLFGSMSAPGFILADEANHRLVGYLLEAIGNIIQYQYSGSLSIAIQITKLCKLKISPSFPTQTISTSFMHSCAVRQRSRNYET